MKKFKKVLSLGLVSLTILGLATPVFAKENIEKEISMKYDVDNASNRFVNEYRYRKVDVSESEEWSDYKRVSDNI